MIGSVLLCLMKDHERKVYVDSVEKKNKTHLEAFLVVSIHRLELFASKNAKATDFKIADLKLTTGCVVICRDLSDLPDSVRIRTAILETRACSIYTERSFG